MGVGNLRVWDKDIAHKQNRHRTVGITAEYVGRAKVEALKAFAESVATAEPFLIEVHEAWGTTDEGLRSLKDCDIVFCWCRQVCATRAAQRSRLCTPHSGA
jgi:tRNA A37 threonylcarbamoyladenosine dehydratase